LRQNGHPHTRPNVPRESWLAQQHQNFLRQEEVRKRNDHEIEEMKKRNVLEEVKNAIFFP
jgi:hypothetical protein